MNDEIMESYRFQPPIETLSQSTTDAHGPEPFAWLRRLGNPQPSPQPDAIPTEIVSPCRDSGQDVPHPAASVVSLMPQPSPQPAYGCSEPTRCRERDKAECEWCMTPHTPDASLPQGDITADVSVPDANTPLNANSDYVSEHVSDYSHVDAMDAIARLWRASDDPKLVDELADYIERLEAEKVALRSLLETTEDVKGRWKAKAERLEAENDELQSEVDAAIENMGNYRADRDLWKAKAEKLVELVVRVLATCPLDYYGTPAKDADDTPYCEAGRCENEYAKCWLKWSAEEATR